MRSNRQQSDASRPNGNVVVLLAVTLLAFALGGCSRSFWRQNADNEVYSIIPEKMSDPRWVLPRYDITPDPASRIFDPYPPDAGPIPPDDPAAHRYMHYVNGIRQSRSWHKFGTSLSIENPQWLAPYGLTPTEDGSMSAPRDESESPVLPPLPAEAAAFDVERGASPGGLSEEAEGPLLRGQCPIDAFPPPINALGDGQFGLKDVTLQQALELSYIHSREYQTQIENLYLQALALTFERFQFQVRFLGLGGREPSADLTYESIPGVQDSLTANTRAGISQMLPGGGQWIVELANSTVWLFAGPNQTNTATALSYSLVQPLLMGAGRKVVLESLTQAERDTLYAVRDLARFRQTFFADTVANGPSGGFLGILQQTQSVQNQQNNIRQLELQLELLRESASRQPKVTSAGLEQLPENLQIPEALANRLSYDPVEHLLLWRSITMTQEEEKLLTELIDSTDDDAFRGAANELIAFLRTESVNLDVAQLATRLANNRNQLKQAEVRLLDNLDRFKIQLGLPPDFYLTIDDSLLDQFTLIDDRIFALEEEIRAYVQVVSQMNEDDPELAELRRVAAGLKQLQIDVKNYGFDVIAADRKRVAENLSYRLSHLATEADRENVQRNIAQDERLLTLARNYYNRNVKGLDELLERLGADEVNLDERREAFVTLSFLRDNLEQVAQGLQPVQAGARVELIRLRPFEMGREAAVQSGLENRFDLKNARAQVMDARRREEVAANALEAMLDVVAEGDVRTRPLGANRGENPFDFRGANSSYRVGLRFTAPLDQIDERNVYRAALIDYQRARRDYMALEDDVKFSIRQNWRQLQVLRENFEIARQALRLSAAQLDLNVEQALDPAAAARPGGQQGLNLLNALSSLLDAQNDLIGIWVNYERSRINIHRDMGMMEIDPRGVWTDAFYQSPPSNPPESHDTTEQLEAPAVLRERVDGRQVRVRRRGGTDQPDRPGRDLRAAGGEFALPRKIEVGEDRAHDRVAGDDRRRGLRGHPVRAVGTDPRVRQSGD